VAQTIPSSLDIRIIEQCGHCKAMAEDWEKLADDWKEDKVGLIAEVDCTEEADLCEEYNIQGFPTLMYGDPSSLEQYEGSRSYDELSEFAKEHLGKAYCSVFNLDACEPAERSVIEELQKKSREDLEAIDSKVQEDIAEQQELFDKEVEALNDKYESIVAHFNTKSEEIREAAKHKYVKQVLASLESDDEDEESEL
jgi:thioredoxin-like negative regulator of GroEL